MIGATLMDYNADEKFDVSAVGQHSQVLTALSKKFRPTYCRILGICFDEYYASQPRTTARFLVLIFPMELGETSNRDHLLCYTDAGKFERIDLPARYMSWAIPKINFIKANQYSLTFVAKRKEGTWDRLLLKRNKGRSKPIKGRI